MNNHLVSIILPVFNGENFLAQSVQSCLNQTYQNFELIIVNDASTDSSLDIAHEFLEKDNRVKVINNLQNKQLPASLNIGHCSAKGNFLTWTSHDNCYEPEALDILISALEKTQADIVYSNFNIIEEDGGLRRSFIHDQHASLLLGNSVGACFLYRKEVYERNRGYGENLHTVEDYDFWLQASLHSNFLHIPNVLYNFRSHKKSLSTGLQESGSETKSLFDEKLRTSYSNFFKAFSYLDGQKYAQLFSRLHQYKEIDVLGFLKDYESFKKEVEQVFQELPSLNLNKFLHDLDIRLRANIEQYPSNQNLKIIFQSVKNRPEIFFSYSRRRSLEMLIKSMKLK